MEFPLGQCSQGKPPTSCGCFRISMAEEMSTKPGGELALSRREDRGQGNVQTVSMADREASSKPKKVWLPHFREAWFIWQSCLLLGGCQDPNRALVSIAAVRALYSKLPLADSGLPHGPEELCPSWAQARFPPSHRHPPRKKPSPRSAADLSALLDFLGPLSWK